MMGIVMLETCWAYKNYNKIKSGIYTVNYVCSTYWSTERDFILNDMYATRSDVST